VTILDRITLEVNLGFDPHIFAKLSAGVNSIVTVLLVIALILVKQKKYELHKKLMMITMILSVLFLVFYIAHHLLLVKTKYGDIDHNEITI
jgi:putative membrane protein